MPLNEIARRTFLNRSTVGIGSAVLASYLQSDVTSANAKKKTGRPSGVVWPLHHPAKAKRIVFLCMAGGPSHLETFDHKPQLAAMNGKPMPESFTKGQPIAQLQGKKLTCLAPQHKFKTFGKSGQQICEVFPQIGSVADE
ncbi:MAG: DUF1501 domain-containing protein, partial [Planctomycetes bacterium]|nr:DUF1501 domain-containing protein [Planctomycetota bacterium]